MHPLIPLALLGAAAWFAYKTFMQPQQEERPNGTQTTQPEADTATGQQGPVSQSAPSQEAAVSPEIDA